MDHRENAHELADAIAEALLAALAKLQRVTGLDGTKRRMTPNEFKASLPSVCALLFKEGRRVADFKMGQHDRIVTSLRERVAHLERLLEPRLAGERDTPIHFVDPIEVTAIENVFDSKLDDTQPGWRLPAGVARDSQRPTPVNKPRSS